MPRRAESLRYLECEGYPLSEQLKKLFEARTGETWTLHDKALHELVSQDEHLSMKVLSDLGNPSSSADAIGFLVPGYPRQSHVFAHIPKSIIRLAQAGHAIIAVWLPTCTTSASPTLSFRRFCGIVMCLLPAPPTSRTTMSTGRVRQRWRRSNRQQTQSLDNGHVVSSGEVAERLKAAVC